ncbi:MAG TPA: histidine kinase dimerization/phospho-acceptor domain-containing protein, partial [Actinotalea sp.]|nr:histidine kinase dimerization/phospho-acceptor domain-containing protein [Actinotalea sp.]
MNPTPPGRRSWSLRLRLTLLTSGLLAVALVIGAVSLTTVLSRSRVSALDTLLRERVTTVVGLADGDRLPATLPVAEPGEVVQILDADGLVVASSPNASRTLPVLPPDELGPLRERAGADTVLQTGSAAAYGSPARVAARAATYRGEPVTVVAAVPLGEVQGLLRALQVALVVVVPLLTLLLAAAIWVVLGRALHPVEQLRRAAAQVARSGGPGSLPVPRADDELRALALTLNEMLDRLEVAAARQRAFVADAAHELRSPIAALRTTIEVARAHPATSAGSDLAGELAADVLRMQQLVDDLLLLARVGSTAPVRAEVDLREIARAAVEAARAGTAGGAAVRVGITGSGHGLGDA